MIIRDLRVVILTFFVPASPTEIGSVQDCAAIDLGTPSEGVCETVGVVEISDDYFLTLLVMSNGEKAGITLHNNPDIDNGDEIYIRANYYVQYGLLDLAEYIERLLKTDAEF